jgi:hypothetical protein
VSKADPVGVAELEPGQTPPSPLNLHTAPLQNPGAPALAAFSAKGPASAKSERPVVLLLLVLNRLEMPDFLLVVKVVVDVDVE